MKQKVLHYARQFFSMVLLIIVAGVSSMGGVLTAHTMMSDDMSMMQPCPFMGTSLCAMTPLEHAVQWQHQFFVTPQSVFSFEILLLLLLAAFVISYILLFSRYRIQTRLTSRQKHRYREKFHTSLHGALACGIIHSKAF